jgi:hypothetical protein
LVIEHDLRDAPPATDNRNLRVALVELVPTDSVKQGAPSVAHNVGDGGGGSAGAKDDGQAHGAPGATPLGEPARTGAQESPHQATGIARSLEVARRQRADEFRPRQEDSRAANPDEKAFEQVRKGEANAKLESAEDDPMDPWYRFAQSLGMMLNINASEPTDGIAVDITRALRDAVMTSSDDQEREGLMLGLDRGFQRLGELSKNSSIAEIKDGRNLTLEVMLPGLESYKPDPASRPMRTDASGHAGMPDRFEKGMRDGLARVLAAANRALAGQRFPEERAWRLHCLSYAGRGLR